MSKNIIRGTVAVVILFIVFSVLCIAIPFVRTTPFWLAFVFGSVAILVQLPLLYLAFCKENTPKSRFYGFPIAQVGTFYMIAQVVLSFLTMIFSTILPVWLVVIVYVVLLGAAAIGFIGVDAMRDEVERQELNVAESVDAMRSLQTSANLLVGLCSDTELSKAVAKLVEELKYSDPVSNEKTIPAEKELEVVLNELKEALSNNDKEKAVQLCKRVMIVLAERNRLCKANK